jgi:two-component system, NarL family, nitrate/nitrite response regulator NarL
MAVAAAAVEVKARVLIAADHLPTRTGVRLALADSAEVSEADDADGAVAAAIRDQPNVCVVDFDPPRRGIRAAAEITTKVPGAAVIVMTRRIDEDEFLAAVRAGATGYVSEGINPARLPFVVRGLMRGEAAVPRLFVARLIDELRGRERRRHVELRERRRVELTPRESDVVEGLRQGMSTREIAQSLGIAEVTVRRHFSGVQQKLGVRTRSELLRLLAAGNDAGSFEQSRT